MTNKPVRILLVDDHRLMRETLCAALQSQRGLNVVGQASHGAQALALYAELHPDVVVMDLLMPGMDGLQATEALRAQDPQAHILVLTSLANDERVLAAMQAGALGYLLKDSTRSQLIEGIRQVAQGQPYLPPKEAEKLVRALHNAPPPAQPAAGEGLLTRRELSVLTAASDGADDEAIAAQLHLNPATVRAHFHHIQKKLGVANRRAALDWYARRGSV